MVKIIQVLPKTIITLVFVMKQREGMISQFKFITSLFLLDKKLLGKIIPLLLKPTTILVLFKNYLEISKNRENLLKRPFKSLN